ncbi:uncharacterized protein LOC143078974 [Mytilus galloprovincialis]|uniref:Dynein regulatory complex protein 12 n=2 Tax=Mytilus TaxID=6548 RepID=A0A8B6HJK2_MYTGA|nr:unnamed protein product [Mytilus edulis]VDI18847.1 Hypothetical predicted protein [Mytilus galloprovincialis]VDI79690.1 Hypothetical predicted protein [Mytilus galloprovincialis]
MPPKKKKGKGKGKKKKKDDPMAMELDDKYKKTVHEIEALKDQLAVRKELARRGQGDGDAMKAKMNETMVELEKHKNDQKDITADMTRQYKYMMTGLQLKLHQMERDYQITQKALRDTEQKLKETEEERDQIIKDKDEKIDELNKEIRKMEKDYKRILDDALNKLIDKLEEEKDKWEKKATMLQTENVNNLREFGLTDQWTFHSVKPMRGYSGPTKGF